MENENTYSILRELESHKGVLKVKEVADLFRVSQDCIYDLVDKRRIPSFSIGNQIRFDPKSLAVWLKKKDPGLGSEKR